jgi:hypothetical protein
MDITKSFIHMLEEGLTGATRELDVDNSEIPEKQDLQAGLPDATTMNNRPNIDSYFLNFPNH